MWMRLLAVLLCWCVLPACERQPAPEPLATSRTDSTVALPACGRPPSEHPTPPPPGAVMPPLSRLTAVREATPRTQLTGYVESTPAAVREWIEAQPDLEVLASANTPGQAEFLVTDGTWRTYLSVRAVCLEASLLSEVITAEDSGARLPTPGD